MMSSPSLGLIIRQRRLEMGLTQEELAERIGSGVRQSEVSRLEHDRVMLPRRARLEQISRALEIPTGTLLARSGWAGVQEELERVEPAAPSSSPYALKSPEREAPRLKLVPQSMILDPELAPDLFSAIARSHEIIEQTRAIMHEARIPFDQPFRVSSVPQKRPSSSRKAPDTPCE